MVTVFLSFLFTLASAESRILLPPEILTHLQQEYPSDSPIRPATHEMEVVIQGEKSSQTVRVGIGKEYLNLAAYVDLKSPSFTITFKPTFEITKETKLYFINRYRPLVYKSHTEGMECGKALKIQKNLDQFFSSQGIKFMTKDGSYLNVLGGDFLLTERKENQLHVAYFKVVDDRFSVRLCK